MPAPSFLIMPARIISRWLATSASAGASLRVEIKNWEAFIGSGRKREWETAEPCRRAVQAAMHNELSSKIWGLIMLDRDGFRPNVGIILLNQKNQVFWGKRIRTHCWQFPQGGIDRGESPEQAMFRELHEEVGLDAGACAHRRPHPRLVALRGAGSLHPPRRTRPLQGPEADLVSAAADRARLGPEPARHRPSRSSTPGAGTTTGCRWTWWSSSSAASTRWR